MTTSYNDTRGSIWRKWDLHVHTPSSYDYGDKSVTNDDIISSLVANGISVAVITDHHNIDIPRIKALQEIAKISNILILPGIEFLSDARGSDPIHFIGIFSEDISKLDYIWGQIKNRTQISKIEGEGKKIEEVYCDLDDTIKLVKELGGIVSIHAGGKNNGIECITNSLPHSMAQKTDIARCVDIYELGKESDQAGYINIVFPAIGKRLPMVICSDNHNAKKYVLKKNCWIKSDQTFEGLRQIIYEPEDRVFIGDEPAILERVNINNTKYINSLIINQKDGYNQLQGVWFNNVNIPFNKELVAIIGNKGSGKSALSDIIGLLGNTHNAGVNHEHLSFLIGKPARFRKKGYAENFDAELDWEDGSGKSQKVSLDSNVDFNQIERVRYLPQNYFESLTNDLEDSGFNKTLKSVTFLRIPEEDRLGMSTFDELESEKIKNIKLDLVDLRADISKISEEIIKLETRKHPGYRKSLESFINEKQKELKEHTKNKPLEVQRPLEEKATEIDSEKGEQYLKLEELNANFKELAIEISNRQIELNSLVKKKGDLEQIHAQIKRFDLQIYNYVNDNNSKFTELGIDISEIIKTKFNYESLDLAIKKCGDNIEIINGLLMSRETIEFSKSVFDDFNESAALAASLLIQQEVVQTKIDSIKDKLSQPERDFQIYTEKLNRWNKRKDEIEGAENIPGTLSYCKAQKLFIDTDLTNALTRLRTERIVKVEEIFNKKKEIVELYNVFKKPVDDLMDKDRKSQDKFDVKIEAGFKLSTDFARQFLGFIHKAKSGTYRGADECMVMELFAEKNLLDVNDIVSVLNSIITNLEIVKETSKEIEISDQVENVQSFYDFIFSLDYLEPKYELKLDGKTLNELSPGEKGALLLVFYLMIDKDEIPLIIDQPEDNLDNKSVFEVLTHYIKSAKKRRQIIIVTHNPNLAVGADAEQIIYVELDKKNNNTFFYELGAIENPIINKRIVEILEGTMPAFDKRKLKYFKD